jgi:hypothetical protein
MYSVRRDPNNAYYYSQYWTMNCQQQHQQFIFNSRQMIKTKQQYFWSTKFYNNKDSYIQHYSLNNNSIRSTDTSNSQDLSLPVYRAPCTFQNSLITTTKGKTNRWLESLVSYQLVEQNVLFEFFLSFDKATEFSFFLYRDF